MNVGSTFGKTTFSMGHSRKVWRSIVNVFPGGGTITNFADFVSAGSVPCGSAVKFDDEAKTITVIKPEEILACVTMSSDGKTVESVDAAAVAALGINGFLQEQIDVDSSTYAATGTVVYEGEIYKYMFKKGIVAALEYLPTTPKITWVN